MHLDLTGLGQLVLGAAGTVIIVFLVVRMLAAWPSRQYGAIVTEIIVAVIIGYFAFSPAAATAQITAAGHSIFG